MSISLSCSSYALVPRPLEESLAILQELDFHQVELIAMGPSSLDLLGDWDAPRIRALTSRYGLRVVAIYSYPIDIHSPEKLAHSERYIRRSMEIADELGCRNLVLCPLLPRAGYDYDRLADALSGLARHIGRRDLRLALENHHGWPMDNLGDYERVLTRCPDPRVGVTLDTGHFGASRVDQPAFIRRFADRIFHVHVKEQVGTECVPFGTGETGNPAVFDALRQVGYQGAASLEVELRDPATALPYLRQARQYALEVLGLAT